MNRAILLGLCWLAGAIQGARADTHSVSYSTWTISGATVTVKFLLPVEGARTLTGAQVPVLTVRKLEDYLLEHLSVRTGTADCPAIDQGYDLGKVDPLSLGSDLYGFEIVFRCAAPGGLVLHNSVLFDQVPGHVHFAQIQTRDATVQQLFTASSQNLSIADSVAPRPAGWGTWLWLGFQHLLFSPDRLCFLLGVILLAGRASASRVQGVRAAACAALGLVSGYVVSLAVSALGWIDPRMTLIEAFIGFGIALLALTLATGELGRPRGVAIGSAAVLALGGVATLLFGPTAQALLLLGAALLSGGFLAPATQSAVQFRGRAMLGCLAAALGFLDGFELPSLLSPLQLSPRTQGWMVAGFDLGAVLAVALTVALTLAALAAGSMLMSRWNKPRAGVVLRPLAAALLGGLGTFWLLSRLYA